MSEEKELINDSRQDTPVDNDSVDYVEAINKLKATTVNKDQYDKLREENKKLLNSLINGETAGVTTVQEKPDVSKLRKELFNPSKDLNNLQYVTKTLELREALMNDGQPDPFLPYGHNVSPTAQDIEAANRVAGVLKDCIEYADGDSALFTSELQRVMIDAVPMRGKK